MIPESVKKKVLERSGGLCEFILISTRIPVGTVCGCSGDWRGLVMHHIRRKGMGGSKKLDTEENLMMVCGYHHSLLHGIKEKGE